MGAQCCHQPKVASTNERYRRVLWVVLAINAAMFLIEGVAGWLARSTSLQADSLDFFADAANYGISLMVVGMSLSHRALAAQVKGVTMGLFGIWVLGSTVWSFLGGVVPEAMAMGSVGFGALVANAICLALLWAYREGDSNMKSVWLCSRNDVIGNCAVMLAAAGVFGTGKGWPDAVVAGIMGVLALQGAWAVLRQANAELHPAMRRAVIVLAISVLAWPGQLAAADVKVSGQVICCQDCWNKADRTKVRFGTVADLTESAGCIANGEPSLLAAQEAGKTVFYHLEKGQYAPAMADWTEHIGDDVEITGTVRAQKSKRFLRVNALKVVKKSAAGEEALRAMGTAPALALKDLSGVEQTLASRRGRLVVLNFWGTFCIPCAKEMPDLAAIQAEYAALGVEVIGATADTAEDRPKVLAFVKKYKINFPVWLGASADHMRLFGLGEALPATVILDREGKIVWQKRGMTTKAELAKELDALMAKAEAQFEKRETVAKASAPDVSRVPS